VYRSRGQGDVLALDALSLDIREEEFIAIVGQSGCGKSTLLRLISGLLAPTRGSIALDGRAVRGPRSDVGIVFQSPVLLPWRTALENVLLPIEFLKRDRRQFEPQARELLALVGLKGFEQGYPRSLSGGMQQRVSISRALVADPRVLLMDEPFGALDAMTREELSFELLRIWDERKKTILFVTHSIPEAVLLANRVVVMTPRPGRVARIVPVQLPRPRTLEMEFSPEFRSATEEIRELIYRKTVPAQ
jgi:NitT/TauT family transport system ATP-binding protein